MSARPPRREPPAPAWDPLHDFLTLRERFNRLFESVLRKGEFSEGEVPGWAPAVDLRETAETYVLTAELPGVRREDLQIRVEPGMLIIEGQRPMEKDARDADHLRIERSYGRFSRSFHLASPIDAGKVTARYHLGVLEILVPKSPDAQTRPIQINVS